MREAREALKENKTEATRSLLKATKIFNQKLAVSLRTDRGCVRELNEDNCLYFRPEDAELLEKKGSILIVADGMGGHSAGEIASRMAVEIVRKVYYEASPPPLLALKSAFFEANRLIYETSLKDKQLEGMGTTCTALALQAGSAVCAHVGDSRLYLRRGDQMYVMTEDHSQVREMVKQGLISAEQSRHHPDKNIVLRALGTHAEVEVFTWQDSIREGDKFLLSSDGLHDLVDDREIEKALIIDDPHEACDQLMMLAKKRGGYDNITA
ncbi:MAG TPA: Stp1/IreP family PP2C-type Ser/Thr phosphatase, partial [Blastocatellia bacterium]|nr:Stp1/IreP family PP2C-type Ser/Thr phosphatase [Blastocatellia bacterium]